MSFDPIPASGNGAELFDQPALFYLTNKKLIEEWAKLQEVAARSASTWLADVYREELSNRVADLSLNLNTTFVRGPRSFEHVLVYPDEMPIVDDAPAFGLGIGWPGRTVSPPDSTIFVCVLRGGNKTGAEAARRYLDAGGREYRESTSRRGRDGEEWPVYWHVKAASNWWTDLDSLCDTLVSETMVLLEATLPALEHAAMVEDLDQPASAVESDGLG